MAYNFADVKEGAIFQYSLDDGLTWEVLGAYLSDENLVTGIEWYNDEKRSWGSWTTS